MSLPPRCSHRIAGATCKVLGVDLATALELFGQFFVKAVTRWGDKTLRCSKLFQVPVQLSSPAQACVALADQLLRPWQLSGGDVCAPGPNKKQGSLPGCLTCRDGYERLLRSLGGTLAEFMSNLNVVGIRRALPWVSCSCKHVRSQGRGCSPTLTCPCRTQCPAQTTSCMCGCHATLCAQWSCCLCCSRADAHGTALAHCTAAAHAP